MDQIRMVREHANGESLAARLLTRDTPLEQMRSVLGSAALEGEALGIVEGAVGGDPAKKGLHGDLIRSERSEGNMSGNRDGVAHVELAALASVYLYYLYLPPRLLEVCDILGH